MVRPHALELYEYAVRKNRDDKFDQSYKDRVSLHIRQTGIDDFLDELLAIKRRHERARKAQKPTLIREFIQKLREAGEEQFAAIEALRGPWRRRLKLFYASVLKLDELGPEMSELSGDDIATDDMVLRFLERHSDRSHSSNYRDARALSTLAGCIRRRVMRDEGPLVRFYSETPVVRKVFDHSAEIAALFDERAAIQSRVLPVELPAELGIFRSADYFLMRVRFPEVGLAPIAGRQGLDSLMESLGLIGVERLREADIVHLDGKLEGGLGGSGLFEAIKDFEDNRLVRAIWTEDRVPSESVERLEHWTDVIDFTRGGPREVLDDEILGIQEALGARVSRLQGWIASYERVRRAISRRQRPGKIMEEAVLGAVENPLRDLGLSRWDVQLTPDGLRTVSSLIRDLHDADSVVWQDACRSFASYVEEARSSAEKARLVCSVLWLFREYSWICEILDELQRLREGQANTGARDLIVWRGAAWIRGVADLQSGAAAVRACEDEVRKIRTEIESSLSLTPLLALGLGYVLYHCWKRVGAEDLGGDVSLMARHRAWVEESLKLAEEAKRALPRRTLSWGLATNHCVYVGMEAGAAAETIMGHMKDLSELEAYDIWTARFSDTAACYYMWRFEQETRATTGADAEKLGDLLVKAESYLEQARRGSIGDIAISEHEIRLDVYKVQLRRMTESPRETM
jgi:hypothetical protein